MTVIFDLETYEQCKAAQRALVSQHEPVKPEPKPEPEPEPDALPDDIPRFQYRSIAQWREALARRKLITMWTSEPYHHPPKTYGPGEIERDWLLVAHHYNEIIADVAERHGVTVADIKGPRRTNVIVQARMEAICEVFKAYPLYSLPELGRVFGNRDHTTILHCLRKYGPKYGVTYPPRAFREMGVTG